MDRDDLIDMIIDCSESGMTKAEAAMKVEMTESDLNSFIAEEFYDLRWPLPSE